MMFILGAIILSELIGPKVFIRLFAFFITLLVFIYNLGIKFNWFDQSDWIIKETNPQILWILLSGFAFFGLIGFLIYEGNIKLLIGLFLRESQL